MNPFAKSFSLSACALAASVLISACGGGTAGDTLAPTAIVTSAASTVAGNTTFTFVFSESVGTSFSVEDLVVTGGSAVPPSFSKSSDGLTYTVDVTPNVASVAPTVVLPAGKVFDTANNPNAVAFTVAPPAPTIPTTAAATPTALAANVISIYSDAYTNVAGTDFFPNWGQSSVVSDFSAAGNATKKVTNLNYQGIALAAPVDVSGMEKLHIDVWSETGATLNVGIITSAAINGGAALEKQLPQTLVAGWNSLDIPLTSFTSPTPNLAKIDQLILAGSGTVYYDNLYFWKAPTIPVSCGTTEPTCAPTTVIPAGALTIYSETTATTGFNAFPNWGQSTQYSEVTLAANKSLKYSNLNYEGIEFAPVDVSTKGKLHLDVWSAAASTLNVGIITSAASNGGAALEKQLPQTLAAGWNSVDIPLTSFTSPTPNLSKIDQLIFVGSGTIFVDNIYFWDVAIAGGGSPATCTPTAPAASPNLLTFDGDCGVISGFQGTGATAVVADPAGGTNMVGMMVKPAGEVAAFYAGATISNGANNSIPTIPFVTGKTTVTLRVYSAYAGVRVHLKLENAANPGINVEHDAFTTQVNTWETLTFNLSDTTTHFIPNGPTTYNQALPTANLDLTKTYNKANVFFDYGLGSLASGAYAPMQAERTYYFDDLKFVP